MTVVYRSFASDAEALEYAIHNQRDRRNFTDAQILGLVETVDKRVTGFKGISPIATSVAIERKPSRTAELTASTIGTGRRKVEESRVVLTDPLVKEKVKKGELSIHAGAQRVKAKRAGKAPEKKHGRVTLQLSRADAEAVLRILLRAKASAPAAALKQIKKALA